MPYQMALDELLFRSFQEHDSPILRFYFSDGPWVSVGYSERDFERIKQEGPACKRLTGGGRVYHGEDLIFSLVARKKHDESFSSVRVSYWKIHEALKKGFERLGIESRFYRCDEELPSGAECFDYPISTDLAVKNQKIAGGAQKRSAGALLHQESIQLPKSHDWNAVMKACLEGFEDIFGVNIEHSEWDPKFLTEARVKEEDVKAR